MARPAPARKFRHCGGPRFRGTLCFDAGLSSPAQRMAAMPMIAPSRGSTYIETRSRLAKALSESTPFNCIQIVDDTLFDADVLAGVSQKFLGRETAIDIARDLKTLHRQWSDSRPSRFSRRPAGTDGLSNLQHTEPQADGLHRAACRRLRHDAARSTVGVAAAWASMRPCTRTTSTASGRSDCCCCCLMAERRRRCEACDNRLGVAASHIAMLSLCHVKL